MARIKSHFRLADFPFLPLDNVAFMSLFFLGAGGALIWTILIYSKFKVSRGQRDNGPSFIDSLSLSPFTLRPTWQYSQVHSQTIVALLSFCIIFTFQTCFFKSFTLVKLIPTITVSSQNFLLQTISFPPLPLKRPIFFILPTNCLMN